MNCPHCKKHIPDTHIKINQLIEDLEVDPWLLDIPELKEGWDKLREWVSTTKERKSPYNKDDIIEETHNRR